VSTLVAAKYPKTFAAMPAIAGVALNAGFKNRCHSIADGGVPVWEFHNIDDRLPM
jgi:predicted peptidase